MFSLLQFNVPKKIGASVQFWVSLALIVVALIMSFAPIITLETGEIQQGIADLANKVLPGEKMEIPEDGKIGVSAPKLISSVSTIVKVISTSTAVANGNEDAAEKLEEIEKYIETEDGKQDLLTAMALAATVVKTLGIGSDEMAGEQDIFSLVFNVLISIIAFIAVLVMTILIPIMVIIMAIKSIFIALRNIQTPENASAELGNKLSTVLSLPFTLMLFQCVIPGMSYGSGIVTICYMAIASTVLNFVVSRMREYPNEQFKYLNIIQLPAFVGIIGFLVFFFNITKSDVFTTFAHGKFAMYMTKAMAYTATKQDVNTSYIIDAVLILVYLVVMLSCVSYIESAARRFSCTIKRERPKGILGLFYTGKLHDNNIVKACFMLLAFIIPTYIKGQKHYYENPLVLEGAGDASFLELTADQESALTMALVGIIIMILAEVAVIVLKKVFCPNISTQDAEALMTGHAMTSAERLEAAKKIVAEAEVAQEPAKEPVEEAATVAETEKSE